MRRGRADAHSHEQPQKNQQRQGAPCACGLATCSSWPARAERIALVAAAQGFLEGFSSDTASASASERAKLFAPAVRDLHSGLASQGQTDAPAANADLDFHFVRRAQPLGVAAQCARLVGLTAHAHWQVSLVTVGGRLYELDGNNDGPIDCGVDISSQDAFLPVRHRPP